VKEHWIYGKEDGWARLRYDPKTKTFDVLANRGGNAVRSTIFHNPNFNRRDKSPFAQSSRWQTSVPDVQGKFKVTPASPGKPGSPAPNSGGGKSTKAAGSVLGSPASGLKTGSASFRSDNPMGRVRLGGTGALTMMNEGPIDTHGFECITVETMMRAFATPESDPVVIQEMSINVCGP
jgi:hypothetical protein